MALNLNASDPNNPLRALLNGRPMTGSTGFNVSGLLSSLQSGYGNGFYSDESGGGAGSYGITPEQMAQLRALGLTTDTQMESPVTSFDGRTISDNGTNYQVDPTGDIRINGHLYSQLNSLNVGGPNGVVDPSRVTYDPRFGLITDPSNLNNLFTTGYGNGVFAAGALGLALPTAAAALGGSAGGGAAGAATAPQSGFGMVAPGMESQAAMESQLLNAGVLPGTPEWTSALSSAGLDTTAGYAPVTQGGQSVPGVDGTPEGTPGGVEVVDHGVAANQGLFGDPSTLLQRAGAYAMSNPLRTAGLLQMGYGLMQGSRGGSGGSSSGSKSSGSHGTGVPLQNPAGSYQWTPNPYLLAQIGGVR